MFKAKYILHHNGTPVVFAETLTHVEVAIQIFGSKSDIIGAGFCYIQDDKYHCYGESISLGIKSGGEKDAVIVNRYLGCSNNDYWAMETIMNDQNVVETIVFKWNKNGDALVLHDKTRSEAISIAKDFGYYPYCWWRPSTWGNTMTFWPRDQY